MISLIIPTYRNPDYLYLCLKSAIEQQTNKNEIIVAVDGFMEESRDVLDDFIEDIKILDLGNNQGMQTALNLAVMNASNEKICIINDDNVLCKGWDEIIENQLHEKQVLTINQIEPTGPGIFNFPVKDLGRTPKDFKYDEFIEYELKLRKEDILTRDGGIFPFAMYKKDYMIVGGFDTMYQSPFICDWDFFLKLILIRLIFIEPTQVIFIILVVPLLKMVKKENNLELLKDQQLKYLCINGAFLPGYLKTYHIIQRIIK